MNISFKSIAFSALTMVAMYGCGNKEEAKTEMPKPGTIVAAGEVPVVEDTLNHSTFAVQVVADSAIDRGVYTVKTTYMGNKAHGQFTMPKGGETFKVEMRKGGAPYTFIVGFKMPEDTTFYGYFQVSTDGHSTKMGYIKSYTFQ